MKKLLLLVIIILSLSFLSTSASAFDPPMLVGPDVSESRRSLTEITTIDLTDTNGVMLSEEIYIDKEPSYKLVEPDEVEEQVIDNPTIVESTCAVGEIPRLLSPGLVIVDGTPIDIVFELCGGILQQFKNSILLDDYWYQVGSTVTLDTEWAMIHFEENVDKKYIFITYLIFVAGEGDYDYSYMGYIVLQNPAIP